MNAKLITTSVIAATLGWSADVGVAQAQSATERLKDAAGSVSEATGLSKRELYQAALAVKN